MLRTIFKPALFYPVLIAIALGIISNICFTVSYVIASSEEAKELIGYSAIYGTIFEYMTFRTMLLKAMCYIIGWVSAIMTFLIGIYAILVYLTQLDDWYTDVKNKKKHAKYAERQVKSNLQEKSAPSWPGTTFPLRYSEGDNVYNRNRHVSDYMEEELQPLAEFFGEALWNKIVRIENGKVPLALQIEHFMFNRAKYELDERQKRNFTLALMRMVGSRK